MELVIVLEPPAIIAIAAPPANDPGVPAIFAATDTVVIANAIAISPCASSSESIVASCCIGDTNNVNAPAITAMPTPPANTSGVPAIRAAVDTANTAAVTPNNPWESSPASILPSLATGPIIALTAAASNISPIALAVAKVPPLTSYREHG